MARSRKFFECFDASPDKNLLVSGGKPYQISLYDLKTKKLKREISLPDTHSDGTELLGRVWSIQVSPDGNRILVLCTNRSRSCTALVDVHTGKVSVVDHSRNGSRYVALFSPNGKTFALGGFDISVYETATEDRIKIFDAPESEMGPRQTTILPSLLIRTVKRYLPEP